MLTPSKSKTNRCGELIRKSTYEGHTASSEEFEDAIDVINGFRAAHAYPLLKVRLGLVSMVKTEDCTLAVSQRLKRTPRIILKLQRTAQGPSGRTALARLEDIGGVRAVLANGDELERVRKRIENRWGDEIRRTRDYIETPKAVGYRALHLVVHRDERAIEVQLRTRGQQQWADAVESADARLGSRGVNLKDGEAPPAMLEYFDATGDLIHRREYGLDIPAVVQERFVAARKAVIDQGYYRA